MHPLRRRLAAARELDGGPPTPPDRPLALNLRRAMRREELFLVYQPKVDMVATDRPHARAG